MDQTDHIARLLQTIPPACIARFCLTPTDLPIKEDNSTQSVWRLACSCGGEYGRILGYPLSDPTGRSGGGGGFISPLGFNCVTCGKVTEIIDTDQHGYHAEGAKREVCIGSAKYRGIGLRTAWPCPQCKGEVFALTVAFIFWDAVSDLADEPGWPLQEFFNVFLSFAKCAGCGHLPEPTDFGKQ